VAAATTSLVSKRERDDRWFQLASDPLGAPKRPYQNYLEHIDSILLANATFIVRRTAVEAPFCARRRKRSNHFARVTAYHLLLKDQQE